MNSRISNIYIQTPYGKLHAAAAHLEAEELPILFIPGMLGKAEDWLNDLESFSEHPCVAISLRGRGRSDVPQSGFSVFDHAQDIESVVTHFGFHKVILVGSSQGALYATAFALRNPTKVEALVIQDKVLKQKKFGHEWVNKAKNHPEVKSDDFLWNIANDSQDLNLLELAGSLGSTPTLLIKGGGSAMVMEEDLLEMKEVLKNLKVKIFPDSGHDVSSPDYELYIETMQSFFRSLTKHNH